MLEWHTFSTIPGICRQFLQLRGDFSDPPTLSSKKQAYNEQWTNGTLTLGIQHWIK